MCTFVRYEESIVSEMAYMVMIVVAVIAGIAYCKKARSESLTDIATVTKGGGA